MRHKSTIQPQYEAQYEAQRQIKDKKQTNAVFLFAILSKFTNFIRLLKNTPLWIQVVIKLLLFLLRISASMTIKN